MNVLLPATPIAFHNAGCAVLAEFCHAQFVVPIDFGAVGGLVVGRPGRHDAFTADKTGDFDGFAARKRIDHEQDGSTALRLGHERELRSVRTPARAYLGWLGVGEQLPCAALDRTCVQVDLIVPGVNERENVSIGGKRAT